MDRETGAEHPIFLKKLLRREVKGKMAAIDLTKYGITGTVEIVHNPSYELLFEEETKPGLEGYEKGQVSELGAVNVMTGIYTGRSPKDKFIVMDENSKDTVWWTSDEYKNDNHPPVLLYTSPSPRDLSTPRIPPSAGKKKDEVMSSHPEIV